MNRSAFFRAVFCVFSIISTALGSDVAYYVNTGGQAYRAGLDGLVFNSELINDVDSGFVVSAGDEVFLGLQRSPTKWDLVRPEALDAEPILSGQLMDMQIVNDDVYWVDYRTLYKAKLNNGEVSATAPLPIGFSHSAGLTPVAANSNFVFWGDYKNGSIFRADADGSNKQRIYRYEGPMDWNAMAADDEYVYWSDWLKASVWRAKVDGSEPEMIIDNFDYSRSGNGFRAQQLTVKDDHLYILQDSAIQRAAKDGSNIETFPIRTDMAWSFAVVSVDDVLGDITGNGKLEPNDIDFLRREIRRQNSSKEFDFDGSGTVDTADAAYWIETIAGTTPGDSNLDGVFDSDDLKLVFQAAEYEDLTAFNSTWGEGDWNGDREFDSGDLLTAFQAGSYDKSSAAVIAVPEPAQGIRILAVACICWLGLQTGRRQQARTHTPTL